MASYSLYLMIMLHATNLLCLDEYTKQYDLTGTFYLLDSEERLAATISATKDSIDEEKNITPTEKAFHINQISSIHSTLLTPRHDDIARTSSNILDYHSDTKEIELAADPYNSGTTNVSSSSRNYQQYCASEILNIPHRNLSNNEDKHQIPVPQQSHFSSSHNLQQYNNDKRSHGNIEQQKTLTDEKQHEENSESPKIEAFSRIKSFHFTKKKPKPKVSDIEGAFIPESPRSTRSQRSVNRAIDKTKTAIQSATPFPKVCNSPDMSSGRRSNRSSHGSSHQSIEQGQQPFDFDRMQQALSETGSESTHSSGRSGDRHRPERQYTPPSSNEPSRSGSQRHSQRHNYQQQQQPHSANEIQVVSSSSNPVQSLQPVTESNGANNANSVPSSSNGNPLKKDRYKGLWGKVGKHGMDQAAAAKGGDGESRSTAPRLPANKWGQVLKQAKQQDSKKLAKKQSEAEINYHMQQQQMQQQQQQYSGQMQNAATGGSYVFSETSGTGTVECDCGNDDCPNCNLLLQMGGGGW